jgi:hypothetical protein
VDQITTVSGLHVNPLAPRGGDVVIEDIAHALSMQCRYNGHCLVFYSVAQHSYVVARLMQERGGVLWALGGLLHDAPEAYLGDCPRPVKQQVLKDYREAENKWGAIVTAMYQLPADADFWTALKECDRIALIEEMKWLKPDDARKYEHLSDWRPDWAIPQVSLMPGEAKDLFLGSYDLWKEG